MSSSVYRLRKQADKVQGHRKHLVVPRTKYELRIRVLVQQALDDLALVDRDRPYFQVLLAHQHYKRPRQHDPAGWK